MTTNINSSTMKKLFILFSLFFIGLCAHAQFGPTVRTNENQFIFGIKTFMTNAPRSLVDAVHNDDLVRLSQMLTSTNGLTSNQVYEVISKYFIKNTNGFGTNTDIRGLTMSQVVLFPRNNTNDYGTLSGKRISGTINTHHLSSTNGAFHGMVEGYAISLTNNDGSGYQVTITGVVNSNSVQVFERLGATYTDTTNWGVYPIAQSNRDINNAHAGGFMHDGSLFTVVRTPSLFNSGRIYLFDGTNSWSIQTGGPLSGLGGSGRFIISEQNGPNGNDGPFHIESRAPYESIVILSNGIAAIRFGFTNRFGEAITNWEMVRVIGPVESRNDSVAGTGTYEATGGILTGTGTAFSSEFKFGDCLVDTNNNILVVASVTSATAAKVLLIGGSTNYTAAAGMTFVIHRSASRGMAVNTTFGGVMGLYDGSLFLNASTPSILFGDDNSTYASMFYNDSTFFFFNRNAFTQPAQLSMLAPHDSLALRSDGRLRLTVGLTNAGNYVGTGSFSNNAAPSSGTDAVLGHELVRSSQLSAASNAIVAQIGSSAGFSVSSNGVIIGRLGGITNLNYVGTGLTSLESNNNTATITLSGGAGGGGSGNVTMPYVTNYTVPLGDGGGVNGQTVTNTTGSDLLVFLKIGGSTDANDDFNLIIGGLPDLSIMSGNAEVEGTRIYGYTFVLTNGNTFFITNKVDGSLANLSSVECPAWKMFVSDISVAGNLDVEQLTVTNMTADNLTVSNFTVTGNSYITNETASMIATNAVPAVYNTYTKVSLNRIFNQNTSGFASTANNRFNVSQGGQYLMTFNARPSVTNNVMWFEAYAYTNGVRVDPMLGSGIGVPGTFTPFTPPSGLFSGSGSLVFNAPPGATVELYVLAYNTNLTGTIQFDANCLSASLTRLSQ